MIHRLKNSKNKEVWFNSKTQTMIEIPQEIGYLGANGVTYPVFQSIQAFVSSNKKEGIIYAFCNFRKKVKKRWLISLELPFGNVEFFNVEYTSIGWINHEIESVIHNKTYRVLLERNTRCINDCRIKYLKEL